METYHELTIRGCSGGFGEYEVAPDCGEGWESHIDLLVEIAQSVFEMIDLRSPDAADLLASAEDDCHGDRPQDILGRIHNEPEEVYAVLSGGEWHYVGIGTYS